MDKFLYILKNKIMCKPNNINRIFCTQCGKFKLQFKTEKKALAYIMYNAVYFEEKKPVRVYYCEHCCAYHTTSIMSQAKFFNKYNLEANIYSLAKEHHFIRESAEKINRIENIFNRMFNCQTSLNTM